MFTKSTVASVLSGLAGAMLFASAASASFIEDFNDNVADGWTLTGLWHVTQNSPNGTPALGYVQGETPGTVLDGNFNTGSANSGTATSPSLLCGSGCAVAFDWLDVSESGPWDIFSVSILHSGGPTTVLADGNAGSYQSFNMDLTPIVGVGNMFQVQFAFNTGDSLFNDFSGVRVDNFAVSTVSEPGTVAILGLGLVGFALARRRKAA